MHISRNFSTLNNNEQNITLQCLGLTWKCYILWSTQLDGTEDGRWLYINENTHKQKVYAHWCKMHYLVTRSTNLLLFFSNITCRQLTLNKNTKLNNIVVVLDTYHRHVIHAYISSWLKVEVDITLGKPKYNSDMSSTN